MPAFFSSESISDDLVTETFDILSDKKMFTPNILEVNFYVAIILYSS